MNTSPPTVSVNGISYYAVGAGVTAAVAAPVEPPSDWYVLPGGHTDAYDVVIEDDGRVHGYPAATWDACHLSFPDQCVTPPRSNTDYAYFKVGNVRTASGERIATGPLTLKGGHADGSLSAAKAMAFYDDTRSAFADVAIGEDEFGMWVAGGLRPDASPEAIRAAMASGFSGDWRWIGDGFELIALSAVNTPGFRRRVNINERNGMVASMVLDMPRNDPGDEVVVTTTTVIEATEMVVDNDAVLVSAALRIAKSIGRAPEQRIAALRSRVHPEPVEVSA